MIDEANQSQSNPAENLEAIVQKMADTEVTKVVLEELKNLTLRYVRRMRIMPYPDYDFNSYPFMSRIIAEELFAYSQERPKEEVKMFIGDVSSEFYGKNLLFDRVSELASQGIKFNIILAKPPVGECLLKWLNLMNKFQDRIIVRMKVEYSNRLCHLILVGDAYRMEAPHDDYEGAVTDLFPTRPARFGFHDKPYAQSVVLEYWQTEAIRDVQNLPAV